MAGTDTDSSSSSTIHVLLLSYHTQGHINPLLQLGKRLAAHRGVRCTLAVTRFVLAHGAPSISSLGAVHVAAYSDGCDRGGYSEARDEEEFLARLESAGSASLDELLGAESARGRPVHAVVYDSFLLWAPRVARLHGASCAAFFTQACAVNVAYSHAFHGLVDLPVSKAPLPDGLPLPGLPAWLEPADFPTFLTEPDGGGCRVYLDLVLQQCQGFEAADHVLVNSFYELETREAEYMAARWGARTVGPTVPSAYLDKRLPDDVSYGFHLHAPMREETKAWLDARPAARSVVYASFGSLVAPSSAQMAEVAEGLYGGGKDFLWVVRASESSKIPDGFVDRVKGRGLVVTWCPQLEVLAHPAVGCFLTHCGWNSTMEALGIGVPMIAMPQWSDQPTNAKYIEDVWRVGVKIRPDDDGGCLVRKEEVARCIRQVMEGETSKEYRENAARWSEKAKMAMGEGGSSDRNIVEFLSKIRLSHL